MNKSISLIFSICMFLVSSLVIASDLNDEKAKNAFKKGSDLFDKQQFSAAATQFKIAYKNKPTWKLYYNIGQCEVGAKRYGLALEAFEKYMVEAGDDISEDRRYEISKETDKLRDMVGIVMVKGPDGFNVIIDGVKRGNLPLSGYISLTASREHLVSGILGDKKLSQKKIKLMAGQQLEITLKLKDKAADIVPEIPIKQKTDQQSETQKPIQTIDKSHPITQPKKSQSNKLKIMGIITIITGGAVLGASIVTGSMALSKDSDIQDSCLGDKNNCIVSLNMSDTVSQRDNLGITTTILWAGGGTLVATGIILLMVSKKKKERLSMVKPSFVPVASKGHAGAILRWSF